MSQESAMMPAGSDGTEAVRIPPRYWWLKRIGISVAALFVGLIALRLWWGWEANCRLQTLLAEFRDRGEPIYPEDFDSKPVPDDENAVQGLIEAANSLTLWSDEEELVAEVPFDRDELVANSDRIRAFVAAHTGDFDRIRQARRLPRMDWKIAVRSPAADHGLPDLGRQRRYAKSLSIGSGFQFLTGDHEGAIGTLDDQLWQADTIDLHPGLIPHLVAIATAVLVGRQVEIHAPELAVSSHGGADATSVQPAARESVANLIRELSNSDRCWNAFLQAMRFERMYCLDLHSLWMDGGRSETMAGLAMWGQPVPISMHVPDYLLKPMRVLDVRNILYSLTNALEAAQQQNGRTVQRALTCPDTTEGLDPGNWTRAYSAMTLCSLDRSISLHLLAIANRRMAAIRLALRLYEVDHGTLPARLSELVPRYLDTIPSDPFAGDEHPLSYKPNSSPSVIYSVGVNGLDDGGRIAFRTDGGIDWEALDISFFLDGRRPEPDSGSDEDRDRSGSTEARDDEKDVENDGGDRK